MDYISLGIISEELEYVDTSLRVIMSVHAGLNCLSLLYLGDRGPEAAVSGAAGAGQEDRHLRPDRAGRRQRRPRHADRRPSRRGIATTSPARRCGSRWPTSPTTSSCSAGRDLDKKKQKDPSGISAFIVERAFKGFSSGTLKEKWGILAGNTGYFKMDDVEVPEENMRRASLARASRSRCSRSTRGATPSPPARPASSARAATPARSTRSERKTFGVEIGQHQLVKEMIAQMESDYQASRLLWMRAGFLKNAGRRNTRETGLAKWFSTVASERAAGDCVQIHGANGYSDEYPAGRFYRNCKGAVIYEGTREIHKLMQADYVLGYRQDKPTRCELPPIEGDRMTSEADLTVGTRGASMNSDLSLDFLRVVEQAAIACAHTMGQGDRPQVGPGRGRGDARVARHRADRRHDRHRRRGARRGADALYRREGRPRREGRSSPGARCPASTSPSIRWRAPTSARPARPTRSRCSPRRARAGCCTRPTSTWRSWSSAPARRTRSASTRTPAENLAAIAKSLGRDVEDLVVVVLDRPRHEKLIEEIRATGARIRLIGDGDLSAGIAAAVVGTGVHAVMGTGGAPEGVLTAAAMRCLNGEIFARLVINKPEDEERSRKMGIADPQQDLPSKDLASGDGIIFAATGVTDGSAHARRPLLRRRHAHQLDRHAERSGAHPLHRHHSRRTEEDTLLHCRLQTEIGD